MPSVGADTSAESVDDFTVLKYPSEKGKLEEIHVESKILDILGGHPRIVRSIALVEDGLLLEYIPNGSLRDYVSKKCGYA